MKDFDDVWKEALAIERRGIDKVDANIWWEKGKKEAYEEIQKHLDET